MIIVDLDDTILDTRSSLRRIKFSDCASHVPDYRALVEAFLLERAHESRSGSDIIAEACAAFDLDAESQRSMLAEYYENHPVAPQIPLIEGAREALEGFRAKGERIVLVTAGLEVQQRAKIEHARLGDLFDEVIVVASTEDKRAVYERLAGEDPSCIVIGDKEGDVEPARELGMHAVRFGVEAPDWFAVRAFVEPLLP